MTMSTTLTGARRAGTPPALQIAPGATTTAGTVVVRLVPR